MIDSCAICGNPVNTMLRSGWARRVEGWEEVRRGGGANKIALRKTTGEVAHAGCLDARVLPDQEAWDLGAE